MFPPNGLTTHHYNDQEIYNVSQEVFMNKMGSNNEMKIKTSSCAFHILSWSVNYYFGTDLDFRLHNSCFFKYALFKIIQVCSI